MQFSARITGNRFLFSVLVATVVIPLPAMTPALLSGAAGAMSLVSTPRAEPARFVPVYFVPARRGPAYRPPALVDDTVLSGIADPQTVLSILPEDRALPFENLRPIPIVDGFERPFMPWGWLPGFTTTTGGGDRGAPSAVPEPATWAMLTAGFMAVGAFIRRRRRDRGLATG